MRLVIFYFFSVMSVASYAQRFTISGTLKDQSNGEHLIGATIYNPLTKQGTTSNSYGFYSLTLPHDSVELLYTFVGFQTQTLKLLLTRDTLINLDLSSGSLLQEVVVTGTLDEKIQESTRMGSIDVPITQIKSMPAFMGETDVLKVLQLLPGVQAGTEGSSGLYVRGGGPDQNLILLDGVPVYNASHLFGFMSVFNADALNHVELIKGGFPARYGGRLSSVIDLSMKEGNSKKLKGEGSIGIIASKLTLEAPIIKDRTSFIISARRTYIDLLTRPLVKKASKGESVFGYYFYDLNMKINHRINSTNRVYLSAYLGNDKAYARDRYKSTYNNTTTTEKNEFGLRWGNITTALRWNSILGPRLFSNTTATYSRYRFEVFDKSNATYTSPDTTTYESYYDKYYSGIRDYAIKTDFDFIPNPNHIIKFGGQIIQHLFTPGVVNLKSNLEGDTLFGQRKIYAKEFSAYIEDDFVISDQLKVNVGGHASGFAVNKKYYYSFQPRISGRFLLNEKMSIKASYAEMAQFIHLLTNAGLGLPTDLWVPSTEKVTPEKSSLSSVGYFYNINSTYEASIEGYYKKMTGLIEYKDGANYLDPVSDWQSKIWSGKGTSYGAEFLVQKKTGKFSGWIGYTLSWTYRQFDNINNGKAFPYKYDRRHDLEIALVYAINKKREVALTWVYGTGAAISLPVSSYQTTGNNYGDSDGINYYKGRNGYRMRAYHRLDLSFTTKKITKWGKRSWTIAVYNAYNRKNPFFITTSDGNNGQKKFIQISLFPVLPSIAYRFNF